MPKNRAVAHLTLKHNPALHATSAEDDQEHVPVAAVPLNVIHCPAEATYDYGDDHALRKLESNSAKPQAKETFLSNTSQNSKHGFADWADADSDWDCAVNYEDHGEAE